MHKYNKYNISKLFGKLNQIKNIKQLKQNFLPKSFFALTSLAFAVMLTSCGTYTVVSDNSTQEIPTTNNTNYQTKWTHIEGWANDDITKAWTSWIKSCSKIQTKPEWSAVCQKSYSINSNDANAQREFFESNFSISELTSVNGVNKITGYYEPILRGSRTPQGNFIYPIYSYPQEWKTNKPKPMPTRAQIVASNMLKGKEIVYLDNPIDVAFLQVQGSGQIILDNGEVIRAGYAGNNEHQFKSFAQWLIDKKELTRGQAGIPNIRAWAASNPTRVTEMLNANPRFIFFSENKITGQDASAAVGALGVNLTAQRSIAVDTNYIALGTPVFISTNHPSGGTINHLVMAQDIGNAIKGSVRADFFWGSGEEAGNLAGRTNYNGRMWVLLPNSINPSTYNPNVSFSNNINNANNYNPNSIADIINR
ncbi:MAG: hypothetical protein RLZZ210_862 [Pseudomonadota bacterium]|jgi:membrane-bound lytic murein transglycosylase A